MRTALKGFAAGFLATLIFHQPVLWLLHAAGVINRGPYSMKPVPPFGVPSVISLAFWGGVWGIILVYSLRSLRGGRFLAAATVFGAILPTLVAWFVVAPLKHQPTTGLKPSMMAVGLLVNGAWGLGTAIFIQLFDRGRIGRR